MSVSDSHVPLLNIEFEGDLARRGDFESAKDFFNDPNSFKIYHVNVASVKKKFDQLQVIFGALSSDIDCIVLSEARITTYANLDLYRMHNYNMFYTTSHFRQNDGVIIYVRKDLSSSCEEKVIIDSNCLLVKIIKAKKEFIVMGIYRSPNGLSSNFLLGLPNLISQIRGCNAVARVLVGDINLNIINQQDPNVEDYLNMLSENGFTSFCNLPTRGDRCLDHMFVSPCIGDRGKVFVLESGLSDHSAVLFKMKLQVGDEGNDNRGKKVTINQINYEALCCKLNEEKWEDIYSCQDAELSAEKMGEKLKSYLDEFTSKKDKIIGKIKTPWITEGLTKCLIRRDKLHLKCRHQPFNTLLAAQYKKYRNKLNSLISKTKRQYFASKIRAAEGDKRKIYDTINEAINYKPNKSSDPSKIKIGSEVIVDPLKIAECFNSHYIQVGSSGSCNSHTDSNTYRTVGRDSLFPSSFYLSPVCEREIGKIIDSMRGESAPGHDGIRIKDLKKLKIHVINPLKHVFNLCIKQGVFPKNFKIAIIKPVFKKGDPKLVENYRPISLTIAFSKIFERIIKIRLSKYLNENDILSDKQYGFREGRNTNDAVVEVTEFGYEAMDSGKMAAIVFMDLSKAFDRVDHRVLVNILQKIGFEGRSLDLFESYLADRFQRVKIDSVCSQGLKSGKFSTPQGTVISPMLYNIYVHEMYKLELRGQLVSYADDTALCVKASTWAEVFTIIQNDMKAITSWFSAHNLLLNLDKTKILPLCITNISLPQQHQLVIHSRECNNPPICHCNSAQIVSKWTYLGVVMDHHLRWEDHIANIVNRLRRFVYSFLILKTFLNKNLLKEIYFALCQSSIEYAICAYGGASKTALNRLSVAQKLILKIIFNRNRLFSTESLFREAKVMNITKLFQRNVCSFVHKNVAIQYSTHQYGLRNKNICLPRKKTATGQKSVLYLGIKTYSQLPNEVKSEDNLVSFKILLKQHLFKHDITV